MPLSSEELDEGRKALQRVRSYEKEKQSLSRFFGGFFLNILISLAFLAEILSHDPRAIYLLSFGALVFSFLIYRDAKEKRRYRSDLALLEALGPDARRQIY